MNFIIKSKLMKKQTEAYIQNQIYIWFHNTYPKYIIHANTNGIALSFPKDKIGKDLIPKIYHSLIRMMVTKSVSMLKLIGLVEGISDLIIWLPGAKAIMVEVKDDKGKQSPAQIKIQNKLENIGGVYLLVRSLEDFKEQVIPHL